jgi:hypothetical protein
VSHDREVVDGVWGKFSGRSTKRVDGTEMKYTHIGNFAIHYDVPNPVPPGAPPGYVPAPGMLVSGIGQCTAWAELLVATVGIHGISGSTQNLSHPLRSGDPERNIPPLIFRVKAAKAQGTGGADYGVREFGFHQVAEFAVYDRVFDPSYGTYSSADVANGHSARVIYERDTLEAVQYMSEDLKQILEHGTTGDDAMDPNGEDLVW